MGLDTLFEFRQALGRWFASGQVVKSGFVNILRAKAHGPFDDDVVALQRPFDQRARFNAQCVPNGCWHRDLGLGCELGLVLHHDNIIAYYRGNASHAIIR